VLALVTVVVLVRVRLSVVQEVLAATAVVVVLVV
jgi:hypothetical protein